MVHRWQNGDIFQEQPCPLLFAHGYYERSNTIVLGSAEYRRAYRDGTFRRFFEAIWSHRRLIFIGYSFTDTWIRRIADEGLFGGDHTSPPQHFALLGLRSHDQYSDEMRLAARAQYGAEIIFYPIVSISAEPDDHGVLRSILEQLSSELGVLISLSASRMSSPIDARTPSRTIRQRWVHETTEDEYFTGRSDDLERLDRWSADPDVRIIAVTGMGGLGKTSLVAHWLKHTSNLRGNIAGVLFWSIYADRNVRALFAEIVRFAVEQLSAKSPSGRKDDAAAALQALRGTSMLLVIDGLELLQDVPSATGSGALLKADLRELLDGMCRSRRDTSLVLLTSRFPFSDLTPYLGRGLRALDLDHLTAPEGADLLAACGVEGTHSDREAASRRFNGHPLGLRLLALTLEERFDRDPSRLIQQVFDTAGLSDEVPLERKLKHLLEFYDEGMQPIQKALLGIVSFFRSQVKLGSIIALARALPAAAATTTFGIDTHFQTILDALEHSTEDDLRRTLEAMERQHLLVGEPGLEAWSCHPILRDHFRKRLLGWAPPFAQRAASFLENEFQQSRRGREPPESGLLTARPSLDRPRELKDLEPIVGAIELLLDAGDFRTADDLFRARLDNGNVFRQLACPSEGMHCALGFVRDDRRSQCEETLTTMGAANYLKLVGVYAREAGEFEFGSTYLRQCTAIYSDGRDSRELSIALQNWTGLLIILGNLSNAESQARKAVEAAEQAGTEQEKGARTYLGTVLGKRGKISEALREFEKATELERWINRKELFQHRGIRYADLLLRLHRTEEARQLTEANLELCKGNGWWEEIAECWSVLGEIAARDGETAVRNGQTELSDARFREADNQLRAAEDVFRGGHTISQIPRILLARSQLERRRNNWDAAAAMIDEALILASARQMQLDHADALLLTGRLQMDRARSGTLSEIDANEAAERTRDRCDDTLQIARECDYAWAIRDALGLLAESHKFLGKSAAEIEQVERESAAFSARLAV